MALLNMVDHENGIKVGDLITAYHSGYWIVTSIEKRFVTESENSQYQGRFGKTGDQKSSLINYELAFDSKFKPSGKKKKTNKCDAFYCHKVDESSVSEMIKQRLEEIEAISSFAQNSKIIKPYNLSFIGLSNSQIHYAIKRVGLWLDKIKSKPSSADADHSALLFRVLSGKDPLPKPPPCRMSRPWYELGEGNPIELHSDFDKIVEINGKVSVGNSGPFEWHNKKRNILVYPPTGELFWIFDKDKNTKCIQKIEGNGFKALEINGKLTGCDHCNSVDCDGKECLEKKNPKPIGKCPKCQTPVYSTYGFCGVCEPYKL